MCNLGSHNLLCFPSVSHGGFWFSRPWAALWTWLDVGDRATCLDLVLSLSLLFPEGFLSLLPILWVFLQQTSSITHPVPCRDGGSSSVCCCLLSPSSSVQRDVLFLAPSYRPSLLFLLPHSSFSAPLCSNPEWISGSVLNQSLLFSIWSRPRPTNWSTPGTAAFQW